MPDRKKKLPYELGQVVLIPISKQEFARGVIVRKNGQGIIVIYCYAPVMKFSSNRPIDYDLKDQHPVYVCQSTDVGLRDGSWKIVGNVPDFDTKVWKLPAFVYHDEISEKYYLRKYDEITLEFYDEIPISEQNAKTFSEDGLAGHEFVSLKLADILKDEAAVMEVNHSNSENKSGTAFQNSKSEKVQVQYFLYFSKRSAALRVKARLLKLNFEVDARLGADRINWLVLARHRVRATTSVLDQAEKQLSALAREYGGEYDGHEVEV